MGSNLDEGYLICSKGVLLTNIFRDGITHTTFLYYIKKNPKIKCQEQQKHSACSPVSCNANTIYLPYYLRGLPYALMHLHVKQSASENWKTINRHQILSYMDYS